MMKYLLTILTLVLALGCAPIRPPTPPPTPTPHPVSSIAVWAVYVRDAATEQPVVGAFVYFNGYPVSTNEDGYAAVHVPLGINGIVVRAKDYVDKVLDAVIPGDTEMAILLDREVPPMLRLATCDIHFCTTDGHRWEWRGVTAFSLVWDIQQGREADVIAFLDWARSRRITIVRVFTTGVGMFNLPPDNYGSVERVLILARDRSLYVELVGLADTKARNFEHRDHIRALGDLSARYVNAVVEIANEPNHETQVAIVKDPAYLTELYSIAKSASPDTLVALGSSHGGDDENVVYWGGDYVTIHTDRKGGWDSVRHIREQQAIRDGNARYRKPVVNDEPDKVLSADQHFGMGLLTRLYSIGDTIHLDGLRYGRIPVGSDSEVVDARIGGWDAIPADWEGSYCNNSTVSCGGAIKSWSDSQIVRLYGATTGGRGFIVGLGVSSEASIEWVWPHELLANSGQARLWSIHQQ